MLRSGIVAKSCQESFRCDHSGSRESRASTDLPDLRSLFRKRSFPEMSKAQESVPCTPFSSSDFTRSLCGIADESLFLREPFLKKWSDFFSKSIFGHFHFHFPGALHPFSGNERKTNRKKATEKTDRKSNAEKQRKKATQRESHLKKLSRSKIKIRCQNPHRLTRKRRLPVTSFKNSLRSRAFPFPAPEGRVYEGNSGTEGAYAIFPFPLRKTTGTCSRCNCNRPAPKGRIYEGNSGSEGADSRISGSNGACTTIRSPSE